MSLKSKLTYRLSSVFATVGRFLEVLSIVFVWVALLKSGARLETSLPQMITYVLVTRIVGLVTSSTAGREIADRVRDGSVSMDFIYPLSLKWRLFFNDIGGNIFNTVIVMLPLCLLFSFVYGFALPMSSLHATAFIISLALGALIMFHYRYLLGLASFWLLKNPFLKWHFQNVEQIFSGQFFPIWFYPSWLAALTVYLPFRYFTYEPLAIYLGKTPTEQIGRVLLTQLFWILVMYGLERLVWFHACKKVVIQGG
jgi:ABC-2 type transport system permease protein